MAYPMGSSFTHSGRKSLILPVAGTSIAPRLWASSSAERLHSGKYLCFTIAVPSRSKAISFTPMLSPPNGPAPGR